MFELFLVMILMVFAIVMYLLVQVHLLNQSIQRLEGSCHAISSQLEAVKIPLEGTHQPGKPKAKAMPKELREQLQKGISSSSSSSTLPQDVSSSAPAKIGDPPISNQTGPIYIAATGRVYHLSESCPYLRCSDYTGGCKKYLACSRCISQKED